MRGPQPQAPEDQPAQPVLGFELAEASIEASNVKPVEEMVALVELQRAFDVTMRSLESDDRATRNLIEEFSR